MIKYNQFIFIYFISEMDFVLNTSMSLSFKDANAILGQAIQVNCLCMHSFSFLSFLWQPTHS